MVRFPAVALLESAWRPSRRAPESALVRFSSLSRVWCFCLYYISLPGRSAARAGSFYEQRLVIEPRKCLVTRSLSTSLLFPPLFEQPSSKINYSIIKVLSKIIISLSFVH